MSNLWTLTPLPWQREEAGYDYRYFSAASVTAMGGPEVMERRALSGWQVAYDAPHRLFILRRQRTLWSDLDAEIGFSEAE